NLLLSGSDLQKVAGKAGRLFDQKRRKGGRFAWVETRDSAPVPVAAGIRRSAIKYGLPRRNARSATQTRALQAETPFRRIFK
ncbi:MAG TPA: hypothetical protein VH105_07580, partial [Burkholderiales bacterium]|nr:hypothetical protein [Burkholderiales bacterium]